MVQIGEPSEEDCSQLVSIVESMGDCFTVEERDLLKELLNAYFSENKDKYLLKIAKDSNNKVLGFVIYKQADLSKSYWDIYWLVVSPENHRKNIGTKLLTAVENEVKQNGGTAILVETSSTAKYEPARKLYEKMGYEQVCKFENYYAPHDDKILYRKGVR
jgi:ribosomal protein S18 acetylase RimI-like enzyme